MPAGSRKAGSGGARPRRVVPRVLRGLAVVLLVAALFPSVVALSVGVTLRRTATNPAYVMTILRTAQVLPRVKEEFLTSLVESSGLGAPERTGLRRALDDGIPVQWLDRQLERVVSGLERYLASDETELRLELPVVEIKVSLLTAVREHLGERFYLEAANGLQAIPDYVDIGGTFDTEALVRVRPYWRGAILVPFIAGGATLVLSLLLWLAAGRREKGAAVTGGVWAVAGLVVTGAAMALGAAAQRYLAAAVPLSLPGLGSVSVRELALAGLEGFRSELLAAGSGVALAGLAMLSLPRTARREERAKRRGRSRRPRAGA